MLAVQNSQNSSPQKLIDDYLDELGKHLCRLPRAQAADIVEEIRSHIRDSVGSQRAMDATAVREVLGNLGAPSTLAASYVTEDILARAERSRMPWAILRGIFHWATLSAKGVLVFLACVIGYLFGGSFLLVALVKPFNPKAGLWLIGPEEYSLVLGMTDRWPQGHELLGWRLIPIGITLGGGTVLATTYFAQWCIRRFRETRRLKAQAHRTS